MTNQINQINRTFASTNTYYSKQKNYELWAHLQSESVLIQCRVFLPEGNSKLYIKNITSITSENTNLNHQNIFNTLTNNNSVSVDLKRGIVWLEVQLGTYKKQHKAEIKLQEKVNEPSLDNWMMMKLIDQKIKKLPKQKQKIYYELLNQDQNTQFEPIFHENEQYRFLAELDLGNRVINTQLIVKQFTSDRRLIQRAYKSSIKQKDWQNQYSERFQNLQKLFEHLRNPNNYQVLYKKGVIRIKYDSDLSMEGKHIKTDRTNSSCKANQTHKRFRIRKGTDQFNMKELDFDQSLNKQLDQFGKKLQRKMLTKFKQSQKEIVIREREKFDKYDDKLDDLSKQLRLYFKQKLKQQIQKINKSIQSIRNSITTLSIQNSRMGGRQKEKHRTLPPTKLAQIDKSRSTSTQKQNNSKIKQHSMLIDIKSNYLDKFKIISQNTVQYLGSWDWTQLFTQNSIQFNTIYNFKFKVIQSLYNAIAIGVSQISNSLDRSSLTKPNSVSFWGDGEIWQGRKFKEQGKGFTEGDIIVMKVDRDKGQIVWLVNGIKLATHCSQFLKSKRMNIFVYIQMYDQGDKLQLVSYTKN